jgi:hypothetical protein
MYNCIVKKVLFCGAILLWVASASYSCDDGPCVTRSACGGIGGGIGSCRLGAGFVCVGTCPSYCPSGPPDKFCVGMSGPCTITMGTCSTIIKYTCRLNAAGGCVCVESGGGGICSRQDC